MEWFQVIAYSAACLIFIANSLGKETLGRDVNVKLLPLGLAVWVFVSVVLAIRAL